MNTPSRRIVVIGASAGGLEILRSLLGAIPADFSAPIALVLHTSPESPDILHEILDRAGPLRAVSAVDGDMLRPGVVYIAPPDRHLLVEPGRARVSRGPRENLFRPAVDPLFRSAAQVCGPAAIGVILSGNLDDGTAGLWAIKRMGGTAIVQDPLDAMFPVMPRSALEHVDVDYCVACSAIPGLLVRLTTAPATEREGGASSREMEIEVDIAKEKDALDAGLGHLASPSIYACPESHGVLAGR